MATTTADLGRKDVVSPTKGKYYVKYTWVIDEVTKRPVKVRVSYEFTS